MSKTDDVRRMVQSRVGEEVYSIGKINNLVQGLPGYCPGQDKMLAYARDNGLLLNLTDLGIDSSIKPESYIKKSDVPKLLDGLDLAVSLNQLEIELAVEELNIPEDVRKKMLKINYECRRT